MKIKLTENYSEFIQKDSIFDVEKEYKHYYLVYWSSMFGTYPVKISKKICIIYTDEMELVDTKKKEEYDAFMMAYYRKKLNEGDEN